MTAGTAAKDQEKVQEKTVEETFCDRLKNANKIVRKNMYWSMGISAIPVPLVDLIGVAAFQAKGLKELSNLYDIPFFTHTVKNILAMLLAGSGSVYLGIPLTQWLGKSIAASSLKTIPIVGQTVAIITVPIVTGALTYAIGKVFIQHFESGGTFLSFDPEKVRNYFQQQFEEGLKVAKEMA